MAWESLIPGPGWVLGAPQILGGLRGLLGSTPTPATEQTQREYQLEQARANPEAFWDEPFGQTTTEFGQPFPTAPPSPPLPPPSQLPPATVPPTIGDGGTSSQPPPTQQPPAEQPPPTYDDGNPWTGPPSPPPSAQPDIPRYESGEPWPALPTYPGGGVWWPNDGSTSFVDAQRGGYRMGGAFGEMLRALQRLSRPRARIRIRERRPRVRIEDVIGAGIIAGFGGALDPAGVGTGTNRAPPPRPEPVPVPTLPRTQLPPELNLPPAQVDPWRYQMPQPLPRQQPAPMGRVSAGGTGAGRRFPWPALGLLAPLLRSGSSSSTVSTLTMPRSFPPSVPPSQPAPQAPPNFPPGGGGGLTPSNPVGARLPTERSRCRCEKCKKPKRSKPRKCLERANVVWQSGSKKGALAGTRCVRFATGASR